MKIIKLILIILCFIFLSCNDLTFIDIDDSCTYKSKNWSVKKYKHGWIVVNKEKRRALEIYRIGGNEWKSEEYQRKYVTVFSDSCEAIGGIKHYIETKGLDKIFE